MSRISIAELSTLLKGIAPLLWPIIVSVLLYILWPIIKEVVLTRELTVKIAGYELRVGRAFNTQLDLIDNIQARLIELEGKFELVHPSGGVVELEKTEFTNKDDKALQNSRVSLAQIIKSIIESGLDKHRVEQIQQAIITQHNTVGSQYHASDTEVEQHINEINSLYNFLMNLLIQTSQTSQTSADEFDGKVASALGIMKNNMSSTVRHNAQ